ncbi:flocculation protein FLO11-like [Macadamia integrifolia]|uniref:flocculation protein FLO11-like n=1 Tax=Macadamia integrifolia TaxID=60698 RepID=UPI001C4EF2C7|nr:flocculation protein FLO11-like [Macadamia integrifolia]XP_042482576.1 flocculation protein FLO11-like [Macadamia integrifolia]
MSCFLEILRCIICCEDDDGDRRDYRDYRTLSSDISREYSYHGTTKSSSSSLAVSNNTLAVTGRSNRDYSNSGSEYSISYGSLNKSPLIQTPLRLPPNPPPPKVTQKSISSLPSSVSQTPLCLPPTPPPPKVTQKSISLVPSVSQTPSRLPLTPPPPRVTQKSISLLPSVSQTPLRLPITPSTPKVSQKSVSPSPLPSPPKSVDSAVNERSTITYELETIRSSPAKGNEDTRSRNNLATASPATFSKHSSEAFLSSNKQGICSSRPPQSSSKPLLSSSGPLSSASNPLPSSGPLSSASNPLLSSGPLSSASKATPASLKAPPSSRWPHSSTSEQTLSLSPSPVQNDPNSVVVENIKYLISTGYRSSSSELGPSPSPSNSNTLNLPRKEKWVQVQRGKTPTFAITNDSKNSVQPPSFPQSLPPATKSPQSSSKLPPFLNELCPSSCKGIPSPTPCPSDKTNPATKTKLVWVLKGTTPISSTNKAKKTLPQSLPQPLPSGSDSDSDSPPFSPNLSPSLNGTSPFSSFTSSAPSGPPDPPKKNTYIHGGATLIYEIPEDIKNLIKRDIVPYVLKEPLSPWTYKDYFATLLYAEDFYEEKWSEFCLKNVTLKLEEASIYEKSSKNKSLNCSDEYDEKLLVVFEIDLIPERRPFLLSRDFVFLKPAGEEVEPFKGILHRVVKGNRVLAEFGDDFYLHHYPDFKYDVSFSFNRVCLKRSHQAIAAATNRLFQNFLFPDQISRTSISTLPLIPSNQNLDWDQISAVQQILRLCGSPPYLIDGPLCLTRSKELSRTGLVIREAVLQIYKYSSGCRILVSAPTNKTCDVLAESLEKEIPELDIFRANAAFREIVDVPDDILHLCQYEGECFTCPPLEELQNFKVIFSTFVSSFRLHNEGLPTGHFSHIFLVDASSAMEPEALVVLTNLVDVDTNVVVSGASWNSSSWVRSDIARRYGLKKSYFERLLESEPYCTEDSMFVAHLEAQGFSTFHSMFEF